jgi:hypothetical protein
MGWPNALIEMDGSLMYRTLSAVSMIISRIEAATASVSHPFLGPLLSSEGGGDAFGLFDWGFFRRMRNNLMSSFTSVPAH